MIVVSTFDVGGNGVLFVVTKFDTKCNEPLCVSVESRLFGGSLITLVDRRNYSDEYTKRRY